MNDYRDEFKKIADSPELYDEVEKLGATFSLHIDQIGELDAEIRDILFGVTDAKDFSKDIRERLEIDHGTADKITQAVNTEIFQVIRAKLQAATQKNAGENHISSIERAGGFEIEREAPHPEPETAHRDMPGVYGSSSPLRENKVNMLGNREEPHTEPLVDQLLRSGAVVPEAKKVIDAPKPPTPPVSPRPSAPQKPAGSDAYREPLE